LNPRSLIQPSETLPVELTEIHPILFKCVQIYGTHLTDDAL